MEKYNKEQTFKFEIKIETFVKDFDYNMAMKKIIDEVNNLNNGEVAIKEIKGEHSMIIV